ncbi:MAG: Spx/MgsR family RNA polymerase-binding regulatory protein [Alphaproteobacteria bacterium]|nr:Spx/MgsR family RNA polymerase-binding regulatory protein [Alphaproteobacteria bacterium]
MTQTVTLIGLKACDTCKKGRKWLDGQGIAHTARDVRADGLAPAELAAWMTAHGNWEPFLNRRGTTWRGLPQADRNGVDRAWAVDLIATHPTLMKRPVIVMKAGGKTTVTVGFGTEAQAEILTAARKY